MRSVVLDAYSELQRQQREAAHRNELITAQLISLTANINRDPKKTPTPYSLTDFCLFSTPVSKPRVFLPEVASAALSLQAEQRCPSIILTVWQELMDSLSDRQTPTPGIRALHNAEENVWVLAPVWEGPHIRGGLVSVHGRISGPLTLRDIDRELNTYKVTIPQRSGLGWIEGGCLLLKAET